MGPVLATLSGLGLALMLLGGFAALLWRSHLGAVAAGACAAGEDTPEVPARARALEAQLFAAEGALAAARGELEELPRLRAEVARLEEENRQLRARLGGRDRAARPPDLPPGEARTLDALVANLARAESARGVVLADGQGFPIAGAGPDQEALAALSQLLLDAGRRARHLLPLGPVRRVTLDTEPGATVAVCPLTLAHLDLALATSTHGSPPDRARLERTLIQAAGLIL